MSKELCEKLIKETELIYEIIKNNIFWGEPLQLDTILTKR